MNLLKFLLFMSSSNHGSLDPELEQYMNLPEGDDGGEISQVDDGQASEQPVSSDEQNENAKEGESDDIATQLENFSLEQGNEGAESQGGDMLGAINDLGLIHKGLPFEVESQEQLKELLQKGFDYTQKTQEFAEQRKAETSQFEQEREQLQGEYKALEEKQNEFQDTLNEYELFRLTLNQLQSEDPDTFDYVEQLFNKQASAYNAPTSHPAFKEMQQKLNAFETRFKEQSESEKENQFSKIREDWENGLKETQGKFGSKLRALKVPANWAQVQDVWQRDTTGAMTVEQALYAVHGKEIADALARQKQVATTKAQSAARKGPPAHTINTSKNGQSNPFKDDYLAHALALAERHS